MAASLTQKEKEEIVSRYLAGEHLVPLAREFHKRAANVSEVLRAAGIDVDKISHLRSDLTRSRPLPTAANKATGITTALSDTTWAYIAGIFDGEGHLHQIKKENRYTGWQLGVTQKGTQLGEYLLDALGCGHLRMNSDKQERTCYTYSLTTQRQVFEFLLGVEPYLIIKKERTEYALADISDKYNWSRSKCQPDA